MTIWLDMDGVLADFDAGSMNACGTDNPYKFEWIYGTAAFWNKIDTTPYFWDDLPEIPGAHEVVNDLLGAGKTVKVLTALPRSGAADVERAKLGWLITKYGGELEIQTCLTKDKADYCRKGDILVDDRYIQHDPWTSKGGIFIHHKDWLTTRKSLRLHGAFGSNQRKKTEEITLNNV